MTQAKLSSLLMEHWLGRPANDAEITAMDGQRMRSQALIATHPLGRDGGLFAVEPADFTAELCRSLKGGHLAGKRLAGKGSAQ